jgi:hypothetical protein
MKPDSSAIYLVLPMHEVVEDHAPTENLLAIMGTSTKDLVELFLTEWVDFKSGKRFFDYGPDPSEDQMPRYQASMSAFDFYRSRYRVTAYVMVMDIIFEAMEKRFEQGQGDLMSEQDRKDAEKVMMSVWNSVSDYVLSLLVELGSPPDVLERLRFERWVGNDIMISLPRRYQPCYPQQAPVHVPTSASTSSLSVHSVDHRHDIPTQ